MFSWLVPGCLDPVEEGKIGSWLATFYSSASPIEEMTDIFLQHKLNVKSFVSSVELHLARKERMLRPPSCLPPAKRSKQTFDLKLTEEDFADDQKQEVGTPDEQEVWSPSSPETDCRYSPIPSEEDQLKTVLANRNVEPNRGNSLPNDEKNRYLESILVHTSLTLGSKRRKPTNRSVPEMSFSSVISSLCPSRANGFEGEMVPSCMHEEFPIANSTAPQSFNGSSLGSDSTDDTESAKVWAPV